MFNVSLCLCVKFKCQTICHLCQHHCPCPISNEGSIKCILSYLILLQNPTYSQCVHLQGCTCYNLFWLACLGHPQHLNVCRETLLKPRQYWDLAGLFGAPTTPECSPWNFIKASSILRFSFKLNSFFDFSFMLRRRPFTLSNALVCEAFSGSSSEKLDGCP